MGFSSQAGHLAFMKQPTPDTFPTATFTTANAIAMKRRSGVLSTSRDLLVPDPEIGGGRDVADAYLGAVTWSGDYEFYARMNALPTLLYGALGIGVSGLAGTSEVTRLTTTGGPTGGTFTITYSAQTTAALPYNATAAQIQAALEALSNIAPGDVFVSGGPIDTAPIDITWGGTLYSDITPPTVDDTNLTGGTTPTITVTSPTAGAAFAGVWAHTILPSDASQLPFLAIEERIGAGLEVFHYVDAVINTLHFEADANGYLMGTVGVIARKQTAGETALDPSTIFDDTPMIVGTNIAVTYNGVTLPGKSFSMDFTNNFEDDDFRLGSFYIGDLTPKRREVTANVTIRETSSALWRQGSYGSSVAVAPGGLSAKQELKIVCSTYESVPGSTPATPFSLTLHFPKAIIAPYSLESSGDDIIDSDIEFQIVRPTNAFPIMRAIVFNGRSTIA